MAQPQPAFRKLRGYAFDPSLSLQMDTASINDVVYRVGWEHLKPGPIGEYIEVVDYDPSTKRTYTPVNLDDRYILAADGIDPSEGDPQFHQQMVYAVCMTTIRNFETALGRRAIWSPRKLRPTNNQNSDYVGTLRVYPHALRDANAYYSPQKKSLLFGYFSAAPEDVSLHMPGGVVFNCLSHDVVAHETAHALLDGMHNSFTAPTNPDVLAFHEAFADIVALFQHFTFPEVLKHQIAKTQGDLEKQNLLGQLAQEFGRAIGRHGSLRDAIGEYDKKTGEWKLKPGDPSEYQTMTEPHDRGSILVAAIFDAFLNIYKARVVDLLRIASGGLGVLPKGELHPDLVNRLTAEASKAARHVLTMCVRALDYCPTTDITFGDYLRAIITADADAVEDDVRNYRLAFIDAFRKRGIYPKGIKTLAVDSLVYRATDKPELWSRLTTISQFLREFRQTIYYETDRGRIYDATKAAIRNLHARINAKFEESVPFEELTGLCFSAGWDQLGIPLGGSESPEGPAFQVSSLAVASRVGPQGKPINHIILALAQRCGVICRRQEADPDAYVIDTYVPARGRPTPPDGFEFKGSCTLIFDLDTLRLRYVISKPLLDPDIMRISGRKELNRERIINQYHHMVEERWTNTFASYFSDSIDNSANEPFAFLHNIP
jgi:hypothetical protein